jgi:uncharacterized protein YqhQ
MTSRPYIGGQAVLEGVMMRAPKSFAVVVRRRDGSLLVRERATSDARSGVVRWPFVRGVASLVESLRLGSEALRFSIEQMEADLPGMSAPSGAGLGVLAALGVSLVAVVTGGDGVAAVEGSASGKRMTAGGGLMLALAIGFFVALPQGLAAVVNRVLGLGLPVQSAAFQAITGVIKLVVVVGYMLAIRRVPEIRRMFQYHGAEHKTITTYEAGEALVVENARSKTTFHARCGTTFLVMVVIVSIGLFALLGASLPRIHTGNAVLDNALFFACKLPFLPVLVAVTFELQRLFARYAVTGPLRALLWPGFLVQRITTDEPDDAQLEVALASLRTTLFRQEAQEQEQERATVAHGDVQFPSYAALAAAPSLRG